jgi:hypothetical protein
MGNGRHVQGQQEARSAGDRRHAAEAHGRHAAEAHGRHAAEAHGRRIAVQKACSRGSTESVQRSSGVTREV